MDKILIQPRKIMQGWKGLTALRTIRSSYSLESPLIVRHLAYKPISQLNHESGKKETLSRANLNFAHSTWARWWRSWPQQDGTPFLIVLAWWSLADCSPIIHYGWASSSVQLHISMNTYEWQASSMWALRVDSSWTCTSFLRIATLKPTYGSSIAYGQLLQI